MKRMLVTSVLYTLITAAVFGLGYPLLVLLIGHSFFPQQASGSLVTRNGHVVGSQLLGQAFSGPGYFHSRPSAAGTGYDAANSSGSNLAPTSKALVDRIGQSVAQEQDAAGTPVPVDLVTTSGSGLDPDITPAAAAYQAARVAQARGLSPAAVQQLIAQHTEQRQLGLLGEPRVHVLELNLALDAATRKP